MSVTVVVDLDEFAVAVVRSGVAEVRRLPPGLRLDGVAGPGCRFVVLLPWSGDELRLQEEARRAVEPYGRAVYSDRVAAVAAAAGAEGRSGVFPVCDLAPNGLHAGLVEVSGGRVRVERRVSEPGLGWSSFAGAVARALPGRSGADVQRALAEGEPRIRAVLPLVRDDAAFGDTPAVWVDGQAVTAGLLLDCLTSYAQRVRAVLGELVEGEAEPVLAGEFTGFPPLREFVFGEEAKVLASGPHAAARGADHLASGRFTEPERAPVGLELPLHRVRNGLLEEKAVVIPEGPGEYASLDGRPLRLGVGHDDVRLEDGLVLESAERTHRLDLSSLPPGSYRVGLRMSRRLGPVLAFHAGGDAAPVFVPLEARA